MGIEAIFGFLDEASWKLPLRGGRGNEGVTIASSYNQWGYCARRTKRCDEMYQIAWDVLPNRVQITIATEIETEFITPAGTIALIKYGHKAAISQATGTKSNKVCAGNMRTVQRSRVGGVCDGELSTPTEFLGMSPSA